MAVLKCKMCGGDLEVTADATFVTCKYCNSKQTIPNANDDLLQDIEKILVANMPRETTGETAIEPLLKRAFMFLEEQNWKLANNYFEKVLDADPENAQAYLGKLMVELKVPKREQLRDQAEPYNLNSNFIKALRFSDPDQRKALESDLMHIITRNQDTIYEEAKEQLEKGDLSSVRNAAQLFTSISGWKDADSLAIRVQAQEEELRKDHIYREAIMEQAKNTQQGYQAAIGLFLSIAGWRDASEQVRLCRERASVLSKEETYRQAKLLLLEKSAASYKEAAALLATIPNWKDANALRQQAMTHLAIRRGRALTITLISAATAILLIILIVLLSK